MTTFEPHNEIDLMVQNAQRQTDKARRVVEMAREEDNYYKERAAAKMLDFFTHEEAVIRLYAEAKSNYPPLAELFEKERPSLRELYQKAQEQWGSSDEHYF